MDRLTLRWFARDLDSRGALVANALSESVADALHESRGRKLQALFDRALQDQRLVAIGWCSPSGQLISARSSFPKDLTAGRLANWLPRKTRTEDRRRAGARQRPPRDGRIRGAVGKLVLMHDLSFIERRSQDTRRYLIVLIAGPGRGHRAGHDDRGAAQLARLGVRCPGPASRRGLGAAHRAIVAGTGAAGGGPARAPARPGGRVPAHPGAGERIGRRSDCSRCCAHSCGETRCIVVSNREPYIHEKRERACVVRRPASGLVTAVEPVMRACSGTWIAHGSGSADREAVDRHDRVALAAGRRRLPAAPALAHARGGAGLLLRFRQRRALAAVPRGACAARLPGERLGHYREVNRGSRMPWWPKRTARIRSSWSRTTTSPCCPR